MKEVRKLYLQLGFTGEQMIMAIKAVNRLGFTIGDMCRMMEIKREKDCPDEDRYKRCERRI